MQRHLSTGSTLLSALMAAQRRADPEPKDGCDITALLASLGDRNLSIGPVRPAPRQDISPSAAR